MVEGMMSQAELVEFYQAQAERYNTEAEAWVQSGKQQRAALARDKAKTCQQIAQRFKRGELP